MEEAQVKPWHKYIDENIGPFSVPCATAITAPALLACFVLNWMTFKFREHVNEDRRLVLYTLSGLTQATLAIYCVLHAFF